MNEEVIASGKLFELIQMPQQDGRVFEKARRAPGVRLIIADYDKKTVLLTREFRQELGDWDYRLPGGKVFDSLEDFARHRANSDDLVEAAKRQAIAEAQQEAGVDVEELELFRKSTLGATVEWDLYVFVATQWQISLHGQELEKGEMIETDNWVGFDKAKQMILDGQMQEERIALLLLQWLEQQ